jgi:hypothetical protein
MATVCNIIGVSEFVKRQTHDSQFTHYQGSWNDLEARTEEQYVRHNYEPGYRDGVLLVHIEEPEVFLFWTYNDYPMFEGMILQAEWAKEDGREHEPPRMQIKILEPKKRCNFVDIVIYRKDVLEEDGDRSTGAEWDIVSINGRLNLDPKPMDPLTIVRNWKHLPGGTEMKGKTEAEVLEMLCQSIMYKNGIRT